MDALAQIPTSKWTKEDKEWYKAIIAEEGIISAALAISEDEEGDESLSSTRHPGLEADIEAAAFAQLPSPQADKDDASEYGSPPSRMAQALCITD